jgi:hypothetical protein
MPIYRTLAHKLCLSCIYIFCYKYTSFCLITSTIVRLARKSILGIKSMSELYLLLQIHVVKTNADRNSCTSVRKVSLSLFNLS